MQCPISSNYHVAYEYTISEFLDSNDIPLTQSRPSYLVSTNLQNIIMPMIRYKSNDLVTPSLGVCKCGRHMPSFERIIGRVSERLQLINGKIMSGSTIIHFFQRSAECKTL